MSPEANKALVRRYFAEVIDARNTGILDEIAAENCLVHRPEAAQPIRGRAAFAEAVARILEIYSEFRTVVHDLVAEGDRVACRLTHHAVHRGDWTSRIGTHATAGKPVSWSAIVIFRVEDDRIAEEWVCRDELGMLIEIDALRA